MTENPTAVDAAASAAAPTPTSNGLLKTTSSALQTKLDVLAELGVVHKNIAGFVDQFVPLDLSDADRKAYLHDLTMAPEADGQWRNLIAEIAAIRCGKGVDRIEGDQVNTATFYFTHPLLEKCDREVCFVCVDGEWRAQG